MDFLDEKITAYVEAHTSPERSVLRELNRDTNAHVLMPRMLSGHLQGRILSVFSHMIRPRRILEIGTYTGYSAICMAEGLQDEGLLHTIDINEELKKMTLDYFQRAGVNSRIKLHTGDAMKIIPTLKEVFDMVFIDADKINYIPYYNLVFPLVRKGGFIIADNVLWSGKVIAGSGNMDKDTRAIDAYNKMVRSDPRVEHVLLPVRDGLMVARKLED